VAIVKNGRQQRPAPDFLTLFLAAANYLFGFLLKSTIYLFGFFIFWQFICLDNFVSLSGLCQTSIHFLEFLYYLCTIKIKRYYG